MLVIGVFFCFGASYAQEGKANVHVTPIEIKAISKLDQHVKKITEAEQSIMQTSRSGAAAAQENLRVLREQYLILLEQELSAAQTESLRKVLQEEQNYVRQQLNSTTLNH